MRAIVNDHYGAPSALHLETLDKPTVKAEDVLVRVRAAALHAGDCLMLRGQPYGVRIVTGLLKPTRRVPGSDVAGEVEAVGENVTRFKPGDEVFGEIFGSGGGACAEYACAGQSNFARKPTNISFEQAAAVPTSAVTALQGLRDAGNLQSGQRVLINGASGGVGTFAVQIAKSMGAEVTAVCSARNVELVRSIGADHVVDYTSEDFTQGPPSYDLILDNVGNHALSQCRRALTPTGIHLPNSGTVGLGYVIKAFVVSLFVAKQGRPFVATPTSEDLRTLAGLIESGRVTPVIDRSYPLSASPEAFAYLEQRHARGKVVITM